MEFQIGTTAKGRTYWRDLLADGQPVSHLAVHDLLMWIHGVQVRMGGVGGVGTEPEHRMKGHSRRLMEDTVRYMTDLGQDVSMLFGIQDFYNKFSFAPCLVNCVARVATRDAESAGRAAHPARRRPVAQDDYPFMVNLYNQASRLRAGPVVRDEEHFRGFQGGTLRHGSAGAFVLESQQGERVAYAAFSDGKTEVKVAEVNAADRRAFPAVLRELSEMAIERRCGQIELQMAADHPFVSFVKRCGCRVEVDYPRMGGGMMRILNQSSLLAKLAPHLSSRLAASQFCCARVMLRIETDLGPTELGLGPEEGTQVSATAKLPQAALMQLVMGYRDAADVLSDDGVESCGEAEAVLDVLFPGGCPYVWQADHF